MHLVSLSAVTWNFPLVGRTRMLTQAWNRLEQPTTFVEVPSLRAAGGRMGRLGASAGPCVVTPWPAYPARLWPHLPRKHLLGSFARQARRLRHELSQRLDWEDSVALVVSPVWAPWLPELPFRAVVYDCIDELSVHIPDEALRSLYEEWETDLIGRIAGAVVSAETLGRQLRERAPELGVTTIRNGVDAEGFRQKAARASDSPELFGNRDGRPLVGFVGALYDWIDWSLIDAVTSALPELDFVFVGPGRAPERGPAANVRFVGPKAYDEVPACIAAFDVCWVPFEQSPVSAAANPVKIYEYLALGKPVVSTPVADPQSFEGLVSFGFGAAEISALLRQAVANPGDPEPRVRFANENSWEIRATAYAELGRRLLAKAPVERAR